MKNNDVANLNVAGWEFPLVLFQRLQVLMGPPIPNMVNDTLTKIPGFQEKEVTIRVIWIRYGL